MMRSQYENVRDVASAAGQTAAYQRTRRDRKKVEMLFANMKRILKMDWLRLCDLSGSRDEFFNRIGRRLPPTSNYWESALERFRVLDPIIFPCVFGNTSISITG
jgi:hypothetical protein